MYFYYDPYNPGKTGSPYYFLAGVAVPTDKWSLSLNILKSFRKDIAKDGFIKYDLEFHYAEMIDPHKIVDFKQISIPSYKSSTQHPIFTT
jgi:hypothetical protein